MYKDLQGIRYRVQNGHPKSALANRVLEIVANALAKRLTEAADKSAAEGLEVVWLKVDTKKLFEIVDKAGKVSDTVDYFGLQLSTE